MLNTAAKIMKQLGRERLSQTENPEIQIIGRNTDLMKSKASDGKELKIKTGISKMFAGNLTGKGLTTVM